MDGETEDDDARDALRLMIGQSSARRRTEMTMTLAVSFHAHHSGRRRSSFRRCDVNILFVTLDASARHSGCDNVSDSSTTCHHTKKTQYVVDSNTSGKRTGRRIVFACQTAGRQCKGA
jgi:hypothetical protein